MTDLTQLSRQRKDRGEKMEAFFSGKPVRTPRERLVLLTDVLNSLVDEHNAITEPEGRFSDRIVVRADLTLIGAFDAWYAGGDIMDLVSALNRCVPYDPTLICGCLPRRP